MSEPLTVCSYGGGVQSNALLVLAAQGELDIKTFLFANVGDDSEHPATLRYVHDVAMPYAAAHGLEIIELRRMRQDGTPAPTLLEWTANPDKTTIHIPMRLGSGAPAKRQCTSDYKITVINAWLRKHGATKAYPAYLALGISRDEWWRQKDSQQAYRKNIYPLCDRGMTRLDCMNVIQRAGLPIPPKSSCWFCPFHTIRRWQEMAETEKDLFDRAVALEAAINTKRQRKGKDNVYFTDRLIPLNHAIGKEAQGKLFEAEPTCDSGFCFM